METARASLRFGLIHLLVGVAIFCMLANLARQKVRNDRQFEASLNELHQKHRCQLDDLAKRHYAREFRRSLSLSNSQFDPLLALRRPAIIVSDMQYSYSGEADGITRTIKEKMKDEFAADAYRRGVLNTRCMSVVIPLLVLALGWLGSHPKRWRQRFLVTALVVLPIAAVFGGAKLLVDLNNSIRDAYASEWVSLILIEHLEATYEWPSTWDDLREDYVRACERHGDRPFSFEELRKRIEIDFKIDPLAIDTARRGSPVFLRSRSGARLASPDPNERIRDYLLSSSSQ